MRQDLLTTQRVDPKITTGFGAPTASIVGHMLLNQLSSGDRL
ncbi:hypothetical protein BN903_81 [Halorubrum sp. AJ67]|nr:hypothetical protein BN903_81 [Halorubrum sp. AJ67]